MNTLPCETCLVFPLCKQRVKSTIQDYFTPLDCIIGLKCPFLMAFLFDNNDNAYLRKIVIGYFGFNPHSAWNSTFNDQSFYYICRRLFNPSLIKEIILSAYKNE